MKLCYLEYFCEISLIVVGSAFQRDDLRLPLVPVDLDEHSGVGASKCHISSHYCYLIVNHWKIQIDKRQINSGSMVMWCMAPVT